MAKNNSPDHESEQENSSDHENEKDNSSDHENEQENSPDHESEQENSSDHENEQENSSDHENEKDNSSDHENEKDSSSDESEKENSSDDESEEYNPKAGAIKKRKAGQIKKRKAGVIKKRKIAEEDDTEETLQLLLESIKNGESKIMPPDRINERVVGISIYSKCIYKQLTESDVNGGQSRLMLGKKEVKDNFLSGLEKSEIPGVEGVDVLVYGPDGESHEMKFKMWNKDTPVLTNGWSKFVKDYELQKYSDVLTIWMFKAWRDGKICFVIDSTRFDDITKPLSKRILKNVFK